MSNFESSVLSNPFVLTINREYYLCVGAVNVLPPHEVSPHWQHWGDTGAGEDWRGHLSTEWMLKKHPTLREKILALHKKATEKGLEWPGSIPGPDPE